MVFKPYYFNPVRGTLLPNFFVIYFGQVFPQGSILSDGKKMKMVKLGKGYGIWVLTVAEAIKNLDDIVMVMSTAAEICPNLDEGAFIKKVFLHLV